MNGARTTVDRTEAEKRESERNRVAWNLPREVRRTSSKPADETAKERGPVPDATDEVAKDE